MLLWYLKLLLGGGGQFWPQWSIRYIKIKIWYNDTTVVDIAYHCGHWHFKIRNKISQILYTPWESKHHPLFDSTWSTLARLLVLSSIVPSVAFSIVFEFECPFDWFDWLSESKPWLFIGPFASCNSMWVSITVMVMLLLEASPFSTLFCLIFSLYHSCFFLFPSSFSSGRKCTCSESTFEYFLKRKNLEHIY